jgi:death-on-curing protein
MTEPIFLTLPDVLEIHAEQIDLYGGEAGIRDMALLESALAAPQSGMNGAYFHNDIFAMAAAYLFHIVQNHPFLDGNKRTGLACAYLFMALNGFELDCDADILANMVLEVAGGGKGKEGIAAFLQRYAREQRAE